MIAEFLDAIWPKAAGFGELRFLGAGGPESRWVLLDDSRSTEAAIDVSISTGRRPREDCYFGVLPRLSRRGTSDNCAPTTTVLWADIDAKAFSLDCADSLAYTETDEKARALRALNDFPLPPSIIVDTGHGYHAYWRLSQPATWGAARDAMKGIAKVVRGDAVYDAARIMRLPGTTNWKDTPVQARVLRFDLLRTYTIGDFLDFMPQPEPEYIRTPSGAFGPPPRKGDLPKWLTDLIREGVPFGQRSEACFKCCIWMLRFGWSYNEILDAFDSNPNGIGAKLREKGPRDGYRWFNRTYAAAAELA
jgi:hypothetical protein